MLLRVILGPDNIQKVSIPNPSSLEDLKEMLSKKLQIEKGFSMQYEDPDFDYRLCNLHNVEELPPEKATIRIFWELMMSPIEQPDKDSSDVSFDTLDTASLVSVESSPSSSSSCHRVSQWPSKFFIPSFSFDVEIRLRKGNEQYEKEQTTLNVPRDMKMEILDKLAELMYSFKAYPTDKEFESVARELVSKHPCLSETGPDKGWQAWKMSLKHKMGNCRQKLRSAGCFEVTVNQKKKKGVKKPKHAEINFLPDHPPGINEEVLECERRAMVDELKKKIST
ncbi:uncharacterized protein LOC114654141 [Erpetoichthys calabaricus]|uniref:uncharacterized protein LOC114654141 n=1 Tax=Erpetoichthys calabaricus TaxID=27687 RepID=UPI0022347CD0|nr:uncharacterized protein LOC114654141 [Erpetoichthys calabaricus]